MPASLRRRSLRQALGANRKSKSTWWIGGQTVRVCINRVSRRGCVHREKAGKGAEKSWTSVRRKRGLRKGKSRSRGRQPRERLVPPPDSKLPSARSIAHYCRAFDHWEERVQQFDKLLEKSSMVSTRHFSVGGPENYCVSSTDPVALAWKARWKVLSTCVIHDLKRAGRDQLLGPTFWYHLDKRYGIQTVEGSFRKSRRVLREMLDSLQEAQSARTRSLSRHVAEAEQQQPRPYTVYCAWCKVSWATPKRVATCSCGRTVVGEAIGRGRGGGSRSRRPPIFRGR